MTKKITGSQITSPSVQAQILFTENADSIKVSEAGHHMFYADSFLGALNVVRAVTPYRPILVVNTDIAIQYVSLNSMIPNALLATPVVDQVAVVNGTALGIITLISDVGFVVGDYVTVSDDNSPPVNGYVVGIVDLGGPGPYEFHIQTLPALGVDIDLTAYTVVANAHVFLAGTYGAIRNANVDTFTTVSPHGYYVGQSVLIAGVGDVSFNGTRIITAVPLPTSFQTAQVAVNSYSGGGTTDMGVPTGATSGIPVPANGGRIVLASGPNTQIIGTSANMFGFVADDNVLSDIS